MKRALPSFFFLLGLVACQKTGVIGQDAGGGGSQDSGPAPMRQLQYMPAGCDYMVMTPDVDEAGMSQDTFATTDTLDHIHVSWAGPSHTTFAVNWRSANDTLSSHVLYGTDQTAVMSADAAGGGVNDQLGHEMYYKAPGTRVETRVHEVHVCGLTPSTTYYYKVGGPGHWSDVFSVTTAPMPGSTEPFSFGLSGDSRNNGDNAWPISQHKLMDAAVDFEVFSGDAVLLGTDQGSWNNFFEATDGTFGIQDFLANIPLMFANGNHDALSINYIAQFAFPQDVSPMENGTGEEWYSFDYGNAHFAVLNDTVADTSVIAGSEAQWLRNDLMQVDRTMQPWIFVMHHRPFYTCQSQHAPDTDLRAAWQPIFDQFSVDMDLTGHNHVYERSQPINGLSGGAGVVAASGSNGAPTYDSAGLPSGTMYIVAAGVGAELYTVSTSCPTTYTGMAIRPYAVFSVDNRTLTYTVYNTLDGSVVDTLMLSK